jgi:DNA-binding response OmpR family regulator
VTVLVVDDDEAIRLLCTLNLGFAGYRVLETASLGEAADAMAREHVDLILLDVIIGDENGLSFLRELREQGKGIPVILFTGSTKIHERNAALANAVLRKPFKLDELTALVARLAGVAS